MATANIQREGTYHLLNLEICTIIRASVWRRRFHYDFDERAICLNGSNNSWLTIECTIIQLRLNSMELADVRTLEPLVDCHCFGTGWRKWKTSRLESDVMLGWGIQCTKRKLKAVDICFQITAACRINDGDRLTCGLLTVNVVSPKNWSLRISSWEWLAWKVLHPHNTACMKL